MAQPLTFGVKFEFLVEYSRVENRDFGDDPRLLPFKDEVCSEIRKVLRETGVKATILTTLSGETEREQWLIANDPSVEERAIDTQGFQSVKLNSPPLPYTEESLNIVKEVCHLMMFNFRTIINDTCSFHVHVGNRSLSFPLEAVQNVMAFSLAFEPQLNSLHPKSRSSNAYARPFRDLRIYTHADDATVQNDKKLEKPLELTTAQAVEKIYSYETLDRLCFFMDTSGGLLDWKPAILLHLQSNIFNKKKRTIEFCSHEGTMDGNRAVAWINYCVGLVQEATKWPKAVFMKFIDMHSGQPVDEFEAYQLFDEFGLFQTADDCLMVENRDSPSEALKLSPEEWNEQRKNIKVSNTPIANLDDETDSGILYAYDPAFPSRGKPMTYGIELEFLVKRVFPGGFDPEPHCGKPAWIEDVHQNIGAKLEQAGISNMLHGKGYEAWNVSIDNAMANKDLRYENEACVKVEIISPVFTCGNAVHFEEIAKVLSILDTNFRIEVNSTTGLHVHIGNGINNHFTLDSLKNAMAMFYVFEPSLNAIFDETRRNSEFARNLRRHAAIVSLRDISNPSNGDDNILSAPMQKPVAEVVRAIYGAESKRDLAHLFEGIETRLIPLGIPPRLGHVMAYNFDGTWINYKDRRKMHRGTIEIRQGLATMDSSAILNLIELFSALMDRAVYTPPSKFIPFLKNNMEACKIEYWEGGEFKVKVRDGPKYDIHDICHCLRGKYRSEGRKFSPEVYYGRLINKRRMFYPDVKKPYAQDPWTNKPLLP